MANILKRVDNLSQNIEKLREALYKMEFFIEKDESEKKKFIELLIARLGIKKIESKKKENKLSSSALSIKEIIEKKKTEYERILLKARDLLISEPGAFLGKTRRRIILKIKGRKVLEIPSYTLKNIIILSEGISLSSNIIKHCMENNITIHFLDFYGKPYAIINSPIVQLYRLTIKQIEASKDKRGLHLALCFIKGKMNNQINVLKYYKKYKLREFDFIEQSNEAINKIYSMLQEIKKIKKNENIDNIRNTIFAIEGNASSFYWKAIKNLLAHHVYFESRVRKGATDLVNSLLNYEYGILYSKIYQAIILSGLNPYISFLHKEQFGKPTLVYDMIEEIRQPIVDKTILKIIKKKEKLEMNGTHLTMDTRKKVAKNILKRLNSNAKYRGQNKTLGEVIRLQAEAVAKYIEGKGNYKPFIDR